jgi:hypothetical protein
MPTGGGYPTMKKGGSHQQAPAQGIGCDSEAKDPRKYRRKKQEEDHDIESLNPNKEFATDAHRCTQIKKKLALKSISI